MYTIYIIEEESFNRIAVADLVYLTEEEADHAALNFRTETQLLTYTQHNYN